MESIIVHPKKFYGAECAEKRTQRNGIKFEKHMLRALSMDRKWSRKQAIIKCKAGFKAFKT